MESIRIPFNRLGSSCKFLHIIFANVSFPLMKADHDLSLSSHYLV